MLSHDEKTRSVEDRTERRQGQAGAVDDQRGGNTLTVPSLAKRAAKAGADGLMLVPSPIYHTDPEETVTTLKAVAAAGDLASDDLFKPHRLSRRCYQRDPD